MGGRLLEPADERLGRALRAGALVAGAGVRGRGRGRLVLGRGRLVRGSGGGSGGGERLGLGRRKRDGIGGDRRRCHRLLGGRQGGEVSGEGGNRVRAERVGLLVGELPAVDRLVLVVDVDTGGLGPRRGLGVDLDALLGEEAADAAHQALALAKDDCVGAKVGTDLRDEIL